MLVSKKKKVLPFPLKSDSGRNLMQLLLFPVSHAPEAPLLHIFYAAWGAYYPLIEYFHLCFFLQLLSSLNLFVFYDGKDLLFFFFFFTFSF
jgi:hypothetical protein